MENHCFGILFYVEYDNKERRLPMKKILNVSFLFISLLILNGCGSSRTLDAQISPEYQRGEKYSSINITQDEHSVIVPQEGIKHFRNSLMQNLEDDVGFKKGNDLTIKYKFISYNEGNRFERWFTGGLMGSGKASLIVEASFVNKKGIEIGKVKTQGKIGGGFLGGSVDHALENAAEEISRYASQFYANNK
jgi:hypothetical protein